MLSNHERVIRGNPPCLEDISLSPLKTVGTYVSCGVINEEGVVRRACIAVTNEKKLVRPKVSAKYAKKNRQEPKTESIMGCVHLKLLIGNDQLRKQVLCLNPFTMCVISESTTNDKYNYKGSQVEPAPQENIEIGRSLLSAGFRGEEFRTDMFENGKFLPTLSDQ